MLEIYFPIAQVYINVLILIFISAIIGFLAGLLGIGGGFLMTPMLIFLGIPPIYAVANGSSNILAASVSGTLAHYFKNQIDIKMGILISIGGLLGSIVGVEIFIFFLGKGRIDKVISILYFVLLSFVGLAMLIESVREVIRIRNKRFIRRKLHKHYWVHNLPFKIRIHASMLYISVIPLIFFGFGIGLLSSLMGVGGGFILVPVLIYIIGMPARLVPGTSLFIGIFIMFVVTLLHAIQNNTMDIYLIICLAIGSVFGAQIGSKLSSKVAGEELRTILSILILIFGLKFGYEIFFKSILPAMQITTLKVEASKLPYLTNLVVEFFKNFPTTYSLISILLVILISVTISYAMKKLIQ